jgi:hypothetical protein
MSNEGQTIKDMVEGVVGLIVVIVAGYFLYNSVVDIFVANNKANVYENKEKSEEPIPLTEMTWYEVTRFGCEKSEGPSTMIDIMQRARRTYKVDDNEKIGKTVTIVTIKDYGSNESFMFFRGKDRCENKLYNEKREMKNEVNKYR